MLSRIVFSLSLSLNGAALACKEFVQLRVAHIVDCPCDHSIAVFLPHRHRPRHLRVFLPTALFLSSFYSTRMPYRFTRFPRWPILFASSSCTRTGVSSVSIPFPSSLLRFFLLPLSSASPTSSPIRRTAWSGRLSPPRRRRRRRRLLRGRRRRSIRCL